MGPVEKSSCPPQQSASMARRPVTLTLAPANHSFPLAFFGAFLLAAVLLLLLAWSTPLFAAKPFCGDGKCSGGETVLSCPTDCTAGSVCGDGSCDGDETCETCETDCGICPPPMCNNDGICNLGEDCTSCPGDCAGKTGGKPSTRFCCGLDTCDTGLCGTGCGTPMSNAVCGNNLVESGEECDDGNTLPGDGCDSSCQIESVANLTPDNQFNIGDSIGEGEAADGTIGEPHHENVWSTGYNGGDIFSSINERFEQTSPADYYENDANRDPTFNRAVSGAVMADFSSQAAEVASNASSTPTGKAGMVAFLLGNNDVCADNLDAMTDPTLFETQYRAGLDVLANNPATSDAEIHVSSIPAIYWLWNAKRNDFLCRLTWPFVPCQNLLSGAADDCESSTSRLDPDTIYPNDGPNCQRRKVFHARIRDVYNPIIEGVLNEYRTSGDLPNARYIDIFDVQFNDNHVNDGDCFHPSVAGHALMSEKQWCRSQWGSEDPLCTE